MLQYVHLLLWFSENMATGRYGRASFLFWNTDRGKPWPYQLDVPTYRHFTNYYEVCTLRSPLYTMGSCCTICQLPSLKTPTWRICLVQLGSGFGWEMSKRTLGIEVTIPRDLSYFIFCSKLRLDNLKKLFNCEFAPPKNFNRDEITVKASPCVKLLFQTSSANNGRAVR